MFDDFADANRQARTWCDQLNARVRRAWQTSSNDLYRAGWPALRRLPPWLPGVYLMHQRIVDLEVLTLSQVAGDGTIRPGRYRFTR